MVKAISSFLRWGASAAVLIAFLVSTAVYLTTYHPNAIEEETIISKYHLASAKRYALPAITTDDILARQYNLKRAIQGTYLPIGI